MENIYYHINKYIKSQIMRNNMRKFKRYAKQDKYDKAIKQLNYTVSKHKKNYNNSYFGYLTPLGHLIKLFINTDINSDQLRSYLSYMLLYHNVSLDKKMNSGNVSIFNFDFELEYSLIEFIQNYDFSSRHKNICIILLTTDNYVLNLSHIDQIYDRYKSIPMVKVALDNHICTNWTNYLENNKDDDKKMYNFILFQNNINSTTAHLLYQYIIDILQLTDEKYIPFVNKYVTNYHKNMIINLIKGKPIITTYDNSGTKSEFKVPHKIFTSNKCIVCNEEGDLLIHQCGHAVLCNNCLQQCPNKNKCQYCNSVINHDNIILSSIKNINTYDDKVEEEVEEYVDDKVEEEVEEYVEYIIDIEELDEEVEDIIDIEDFADDVYEDIFDGDGKIFDKINIKI